MHAIPASRYLPVVPTVLVFSMHGARREGNYRVPPVRSFLMTFPPFITNLTRCSSVMSASGSPETAIRSAYLPLSMDPIWSCHPSASALIDGCALKGPGRSHAGVLHQRFEVERLRPVGVGRAIGSAAHHDLHALGGGGHR